MSTKARELDNRHEGDRGSCPICSPRRGIPMDQLWERTHATVGSPFVRDSRSIGATSRQIGARRG